MSRKNGGFRKKSQTGFVQPTVSEIKEEINRKVNHDIAETLETIDSLEAGFLNIKQMEAKILFRQKQLGLGETGEKVGDVEVKELFNGAVKSQDFLEAELNADIYNYKKLIGSIQGDVRLLTSKGFNDDQIKEIKLGVFDRVKWHESQSKSLNKPSDGYTGADYVG